MFINTSAGGEFTITITKTVVFRWHPLGEGGEGWVQNKTRLASQTTSIPGESFVMLGLLGHVRSDFLFEEHINNNMLFMWPCFTFHVGKSQLGLDWYNLHIH